MSMRFRSLLVIMPVLIVLSVLPARAWDETGHKVAAYIAWQRMTPEARQAVSNLLRYAPPRSNLLELRPASDDGMVHFMRASYWPDLVRNQAFPERFETYHRAAWHFTNIYWEESAEGVVIREDLDPAEINVVERLYRLEELARTDLVTRAQKAVLIAWLAHLAGDIHQPLHASSRITSAEPQGDRGGNLFELEGEDNLHAYWDRALYDAFERQVGETEVDYVARIASSLMSAHAPPSDVDFDYQDWAERSFQIASRDLYDEIARGEEPSIAYQEMAQATAAESVTLAGYRLGELMNAIFG
jgi:hypothetical protein